MLNSTNNDNLTNALNSDVLLGSSPDIMNVEDIAKILGISRVTAYGIVHSKGFPLLKVGRKLKIPKIAFIRWIEKNSAN